MKIKILKGVPQVYYGNVKINKNNIKMIGEGSDYTIISGNNLGDTVTFLNV